MLLHPDLSVRREQNVPAKSGMPTVTAVILNTNRCHDTVECLASLAAGTYPAMRVLVLDNGSTDGSVAAIRERFPGVDVMELAENRGYAGNNNVGVRAALATGTDWVFVLNEDTIVAPDCVEALVAVAAADHRVGVVGPLVYHHDEPGIIQSAGGGLTTWWEGFHHGENDPDGGQFRQPHEVEWVTGCGILVRRDVIEEIGGLDERFYIYWEETEWCMRARKAGWRIMHAPAARMWHKGVRRDYQPKPSVTYYSTRNRLLMLLIHRAPPRAWVVAWAQLVRTLVSWSVRPKWRSKRDHRNAMWRGMTDFLSARWGEMPPQ